MISEAVPSDIQARITLSLLHELLKDYHPRDFAVRLWDGTTWEAESGSPARCTLVIRQPAALGALTGVGGTFSLGESYLANAWDIEGEGEVLVPLADYLFPHIRRRQG